jgi:serine/threonine protein kinase
MELLTGEDMSIIRNKIRSNNLFGLISIPVASYFVLQAINCIEKMHEKGLVHRDIKPSNFVRKNLESTEFYIIDFGITKKVIFFFKLRNKKLYHII